MTPKEKQDLGEIDICDLFITPAIKSAGWDQPTQIRREVTLTPGPVVVRGNMSSRNKKKKKYADEGILTIESPRVLKLTPFDQMGTPVEIINGVFGGKANYESTLHEMENALFDQQSSA